jgi:hypothetical protein
MTSFVEAVVNQSTRTTNGMPARVSSANACVDLFYAIGASRGKNIIPAFTAAYVENADLALRIVQWARDVRGGSGERQLFKDILRHLEKTNPKDAKRLMNKIPEIGRLDDGFCVETKELKEFYYSMIGDILRAGNSAEAMLSRIDTMSEDECAKTLSRL